MLSVPLHIDKLDLQIPGGQVTRVTCTFQNDRPQKVGYGERTLDAMCYFVGFAGDTFGGACIEVLPPNLFGNQWPGSRPRHCWVHVR